MSGNTADSIQQAIFSCPFGKNKLYKWFNVQLCILALQYNTIFLVCTGAGFTVKSKYKGIKYSCFSCSGVSGHKKQILIRLLKIDLCQFSVGTKRLHDKFHRSHFLLYCIDNLLKNFLLFRICISEELAAKFKWIQFTLTVCMSGIINLPHSLTAYL